MWHSAVVPRAGVFRSILLLAFFAPAAVHAQTGQLRSLTLDDYPKWSRITEVALSPDGRWMTYAYAPNEGDATLHVRELDGAGMYTATNGAAPAFSKDGRWAAYLTSPAGQAPRGGGRGGRGGGAGGAPGGAQAGRTLELVDLSTGAKVKEADASSFTFSEDSRFIVIERRRSDTNAKHQGRDLLVRELATGTTRNIGNVSSFAFNKPGKLLAYIVDAANKSGNGLYLLDLASGIVRTLDTDTLRYDDLTWNEAGTALAALRGETPDGREQRANALVAFGNFGDARTTSRSTLSGATAAFVYDPSTDAAFPRDMVLSEMGTLTWSQDGARIFAGIKEQQEKPKEQADSARANVEIWHWADERLQSVQKVRADADRRATFTVAINLNGNPRFVQLADEAAPRAEPTRDGRWVIAYRDKPYRMNFDEPGGLTDLVRIDPATGESTPLAERIRFSMGSSPDGRWHLWFSNGTLWLQEIATGARTDLSALAGVDFMNTDADRPGEKPSWGIAGWSRDGRTVLVNSKYDVWSLPLGGGGRAANLTGGAGEREQIRFRLASLDEEDARRGLDTSKPMLLSAYGEWTKKSGYFFAQAGREPQPLTWQDRMLGGVRKAENADRVIFTSQTFEEFPDWYVATTRFDNARRITDANPQQKEYAWGRRVLVDYTDQRGNKLQATLTLPAGYVEGRRYPMLVYFYEKMSQNHHQYSMPVYDDRPHMSVYASDGYLVLMPDIVYTDGQPGSSALDDVTSAVRKVIELGYADPARIGLQGHSWGGYQSSFIVTQTDMFAAVVTGAPLTNLESMHNILYKQTGGGNAPLIQWGQGRMGTVPWEDPEGYASQSPVRHVKNITTPFLILHGTADGAVDWNQGLEFYVAARREGKQVILLSYPDEPHHLAKKENQIDFQRRMKEYFDHYLKGTPAPAWMRSGVPFLERAREVVTSDRNY